MIGGITHNHMLTTRLGQQISGQPHSVVAKRMVYRHIDELKRGSWNDARRDPVTERVPDATWKVWTVPADQRAQMHTRYRIIAQGAVTKFETRFDDVSEQSARTLVIVMVPLLALLLALLEFRRGSGVQHIVFSLHFYSFALILYSVLWAVTLLLETALHTQVPDLAMGLVMLALQSVYLIIAFGTAYGDGRAGRVVRGIVAGYASWRIILFYRFVLFLVAFYSAR